MTNFEKWLASKNIDAMQEEFMDMQSWGDCAYCPAYKDCKASNPPKDMYTFEYVLCQDNKLFKEWAKSEVNNNGN